MPSWRYEFHRQVNNELATTQICSIDTLPYPFHLIKSFLDTCREVDLQIMVGLTTYRLSTCDVDESKQVHDTEEQASLGKPGVAEE